jgi:HrpA-like RNA helicase
LKLFELKDSNGHVKKVEGRTFEVEVSNEPPLSESPNAAPALDVQYVVDKTIEHVSKNTKHTLVFLPGQKEIELAMDMFTERT